MAIRTSDPEIRAIIPTDESVDLTPFMNNATVLVDRVLANATVAGVVFTSSELAFMETWLAAHFYAVRYPQATKKRAGRSSVTFQGRYGVGLEATWWGQTAITMDISGTLATATGATGGVKSVGAIWLGTEA